MHVHSVHCREPGLRYGLRFTALGSVASSPWLYPWEDHSSLFQTHCLLPPQIMHLHSRWMTLCSVGQFDCSGYCRWICLTWIDLQCWVWFALGDSGFSQHQISFWVLVFLQLRISNHTWQWWISILQGLNSPWEYGTPFSCYSPSHWSIHISLPAYFLDYHRDVFGSCIQFQVGNSSPLHQFL